MKTGLSMGVLWEKPSKNTRGGRKCLQLGVRERYPERENAQVGESGGVRERKGKQASDTDEVHPTHPQRPACSATVAWKCQAQSRMGGEGAA